MKCEAHHAKIEPVSRGYVVPAPRPCDAVGGALRDAFRGDRSLPEPLALALLELDRVD